MMTAEEWIVKTRPQPDGDSFPEILHYHMEQYATYKLNAIIDEVLSDEAIKYHLIEITSFKGFSKLQRAQNRVDRHESIQWTRQQLKDRL